MDIDTDLSPSRRKLIFKKMREERGELNVVQVSTYGREQPRRAILTACRGYRSPAYPKGIDVDIGQYLTSLIPQERGFLWSIEEVVYGDEEKGREPVKAFLAEVNKYPGLLQIIESIQSLVSSRGQHASGVILYNDGPTNTGAIMRSPNGDLITQYDLHWAEAAGDTKIDMLVTEVSDKLVNAINLLKADGYFSDCNSLREIYEKNFHPSKIDLKDKRIWDALASGDIIDVFQLRVG